jgi:hypothetical protein
MYEHRTRASTFGLTLHSLLADYGRGVYSYFVFMRFLLVLNAVVAVIAAVSFGVAYHSELDTSSFASCFIGVWSTASRPMWLGTSAAIIGVPLFGFLLYPWAHRRALAQEVDGGELRAAEDAKEDLLTRSVTAAERRGRRALSGIAFVLAVAAQAGITYGVILGVAGLSSNSIASLVIAACNTTLNYVTRLAMKRLSHFELHKRHSTHRDADTLKIFVLKFANLVILYVIKGAVLRDRSGDGQDGFSSDAVLRLSCKPGLAAGSPCTCPLLSAGWTFFWLLVLDVLVSSGLSPLLLLVRQRARRAMALRAGLSDYDTKADFEVSQEYVSSLYRLFIVLQGAVVFPMLAVLGAASFVLKLFTDRMTLVRLCKKMLQREEPVKMSLLMACCLFSCLAAAFLYPQGLLYVAAGIPGGSYSMCQFLAP